MSDIVERLREPVEFGPFAFWELRQEAADEIERLRARDNRNRNFALDENTRADKAEAKLAKVRTWGSCASFCTCLNDFGTCPHREILAILDGDNQ